MKPPRKDTMKETSLRIIEESMRIFSGFCEPVEQDQVSEFVFYFYTVFMPKKEGSVKAMRNVSAELGI